MGAMTRKMQVKRLRGKLPKDLNTPLVNVVLGAYEEGDGTIKGVLKAVPSVELEKLLTFVKTEETTQTLAALASEYDEELKDDELELLEELQGAIVDELTPWQVSSVRVKVKRLIDG